jgi:hypothetical protein
MRRCMLLALCLPLLAPRAEAQRPAVETLTDFELWKSDSGSRLLAQNQGNPMGTARLRGWMTYRPAASLELRTIAYIEGSTGADSELETELELLSARWLHSRALTVEAGKILLPLGEFGPRRFSNTNPVIGVPDLYPGAYPWGVQSTGAIGPLDYTAAAVSLPAVNERYTPAPGHRVRPVLGVGVSLGPELRLGAGFTHGPYLGPESSPKMPAGAAWQDFQQTVVTGDARLSVGYVEARFEAAWSSYQVPTAVDAVHGLGWYGEVRATLSPRVFVAGRFEHNRYPFVLAVSPQFWVGTATTQMNGEAGLGYRWSPDVLIKASLRKDHWPVHQIGATSFPDGYALAMQISVHTNLMDLLAGRR